MNFKQAWKAVGNPSPGNTSWSADVNGRPVFTAWRERDLRFDKADQRTEYFSPPGDWIQRGEGQSYIRRAKIALANDWVCRLILLGGKDPWKKRSLPTSTNGSMPLDLLRWMITAQFEEN